MVERYGYPTANEKFKIFYDDLSSWHEAKNSCRYNNEWVNYFLQYGLDLRSWASALWTNVTDILVGSTDSINDAVGNTGNALTRSTGTLSWMLPIGVGVVLIGGIVYLKNIAENIEEKTE
jgi:hypothetical protein